MMEEKFDIKYLIGKNEKESIRRIKKIKQYENDVINDGWILITIGNYEYGSMPLEDLSEGFELLDVWFKSFKEVYVQLQSSSRVLLDYWENPFDFFVFEKKDGKVFIRYFKRVLLITDGHVQKSLVYGLELLAETVVQEESFFKIIQCVVNSFWTEISELNPILKDYIEQFKIKGIASKTTPKTASEFLKSYFTRGIYEK